MGLRCVLLRVAGLKVWATREFPRRGNYIVIRKMISLYMPVVVND